MTKRDDARQVLADAFSSGDKRRFDETVDHLVQSGDYDLNDVQQMLFDGPPQPGQSA